MLINYSHKRWATATLALTLAGAAAYAAHHYHALAAGRTWPSGGSWPGLGFGFLALGLMLFCAAYGLRKKLRRLRLGKAQTWLRAHLWLGLLTGPLVLFHSGFSLGHNLTAWIMLLLLVVFVSGIVGLVLQNLLPRAMLRQVASEVTYEQIPHVVEALRKEADALVADACGPLGFEPQPSPEEMEKMKKKKEKPKEPKKGSAPLKNYYLGEVRPFLEGAFRSGSALALPQSAAAQFEHTQTLIPEDLHETLKDLSTICDERRQLAKQARIHFWLHAWLLFHGPVAYALTLLAVYHAAVGLMGAW